MNQLLTLTLLADAAPKQDTIGLLINTVLPFVILAVVFYFLFLRPQKKEQQRQAEFRNNLKVGDEVVTNTGIFGKISSIDETTVHLEIARSTKIKILKQEIRMLASQLNKSEASKKDDEKETSAKND